MPNDLPLPALASLAALVLAIVVSMVSQRNVGLLAMALAWMIGVGVAGLEANTVAAGFPNTLFVTLVGVTLLFAVAETNGALARYADVVVRLAQGDGRWLPFVFFVIAAVVSTVGPGAIASVALIAPVAMVAGARAGASPLVMALMVGNGANAGNMSPISAVGLIANSRMAEAGLVGHEWRVWAANGVAHTVVALAAYVLFRGWRNTSVAEKTLGDPPAQGGGVAGAAGTAGTAGAAGTAADQRAQRLTGVAILLWIAGVVALQWPPGLSAMAVAVLLLVLRAGDERAAIGGMPWSVILMVCGVSLLVAMLEKTGGMALFTSLLAAFATADTVNGTIAFVSGIISSYSSTSGVVLPAFLPTVPGLVRELGGGDPLAISLSINVGSALVDVSPLSTLGALCIAAAPPSVDTRVLFRQLLVWGLSMSVVGAVLCQLFAGWMAHV